MIIQPPLAAAVPEATSPRSAITTRWPSAARKYAAEHPMMPAPMTTTSADRIIGCQFRRRSESYPLGTSELQNGTAQQVHHQRCSPGEIAATEPLACARVEVFEPPAAQHE